MSGVWNYKYNEIPSVYSFCRWDCVLWDCTSKKLFIENNDSVTLLGEYLEKNRKGTSLYSII